MVIFFQIVVGSMGIEIGGGWAFVRKQSIILTIVVVWIGLHVLAGAWKVDMLPCAWVRLSIQGRAVIWFVGLLKGSQIEL